MENIVDLLRKKVSKAIEKTYDGNIEPALCVAEVEPASNLAFGHYQCNNAFKLAKALKVSPRDVAAKICEALEADQILSKKDIAGAGFINLTLSPEFLAKEIQTLLTDSHLGVPEVKSKERIIVEFSSPNIAKELHVGHLRSTIIGDCLARLFEFLGHDVLRLNHVGDWGTQFGMLIAYMKAEAPKIFSGEDSADLTKLMELYRASKKRFDEDPEFKKRSQLEVVALQSGDPKSLAAWKVICDISRKAFKEIYDLLDIKTNERGESFYNSYLAPLVTDLEKRGIITISEGAKCIFLDGFVGRENEPLPMIVQKSDGGFNYDTTDMAAMVHRIDEEKAQRIIIVTDAGQSLHFAMLYEAAKKAGYLDPKKVRFDHVPFGVVLGPDGKKFKTRSGNTEKLIDLLLEAVSHAKKILQDRMPDLSSEELDREARILGIDAIKYADLSSHRLKDYTFSYERMLRFEGNTAAFLLYAYVRIQSIKRKVGKDIGAILNSPIRLEHNTEVFLALHLRQFGEILEFVSEELLPNRLTDYLYELAEKFHAFFRDCRVEGSHLEDSRLLLCEATARVLHKGLDILGLKTMDRM